MKNYLILLSCMIITTSQAMNLSEELQQEKDVLVSQNTQECAAIFKIFNEQISRFGYDHEATSRILTAQSWDLLRNNQITLEQREKTQKCIEVALKICEIRRDIADNDNRLIQAHELHDAIKAMPK